MYTRSGTIGLPSVPKPGEVHFTTDDAALGGAEAYLSVQNKAFFSDVHHGTSSTLRNNNNIMELWRDCVKNKIQAKTFLRHAVCVWVANLFTSPRIAGPTWPHEAYPPLPLPTKSIKETLTILFLLQPAYSFCTCTIYVYILCTTANIFLYLL